MRHFWAICQNIILLLFMAQVAVSQRVVIQNNAGLSSNVLIGQERFHISESLYTEQEIGVDNFLSAAEAIDKIAFFVKSTGIPNDIQGFRIWMREVPTTLRSLGVGNYTQTGYQQVFNGNITVNNTGVMEIPLMSPFVRTSGKNLMVLIERLDSVRHFGFVFTTSNGLENNGNLLTSRRYNDSVAPVLGSTLLSTTIYRPAISFIHVFPSDVAAVALDHPIISCFDTLQTIRVQIQNQGMNSINPGTVQVNLNVSGVNNSAYQGVNQLALLPGEEELVVFSNVLLDTTGVSTDTAIVSMSGDGTTYNDAIASSLTTASVISSFPLQENMENTLTVVPYFSILQGDRQLWRLYTNRYSNADMSPDSLRPQTPGIRFMLFDSWTAPASENYSCRMFSNCIQLPGTTISGTPITTVSFIMSHDTLYPANQDSLYLSISADRGQTWQRIQGFSRWDVAAITPRWTTHSVDVSAYAGQVVQLGFEGVSKYGNAFGLDNVQLKVTNPVPLTLLSFRGIKQEKSNLLKWITSKEWNMDKFEIERSVDGKNFEEIGMVKAGGEGNMRTYQFEDTRLINGVQFYRLRMLEIDRTFTYSPVVKIERREPIIFSIENPVRGGMIRANIFSQTTQEAKLIIRDIHGKKISAKELWLKAETNNNIEFALRHIPGIYSATLHTGQTEQTIKLIVP